jgi:hypothetical protein
MAATVTVNGMAAGGCTGQGSLPINGSGTISCPDPAVAPIVAQIKAEKQQEANAEAQASGHDVSIPYTIEYGGTAQVWAEAAVQAEVDEEVSAEQAEQTAADQAAQDGAACGLASFTPTLVVHTYSITILSQDAGCLSGHFMALLAKKAGFSGTGTKLVVDENVDPDVAGYLRAHGYDAVSIRQMGLAGVGTRDDVINQLAQQLGAKVVTYDRGRQIVSGGFGSNAIQIPYQITTPAGILRIVQAQ